MNAKTMIRMLVLLATVSSPSFLFAQAQRHTYSTTEAKNYVGEFASVAGMVRQVSTSSNGTEFLNFDGKFPDAPFAAVVFASDVATVVATVGNMSQYEGKIMTVTGKITLDHGTPEIIVRDAAVFEDTPMGTSNICPVAYSPKWSKYGKYLHEMMGKLQIQWDQVLIDGRLEPPLGTFVTVKFTMDLHGKITEIMGGENTSGESGKQSCMTAITMAAPYGDWTDEMIDVLGKSQELTFRFYYE
jgi:hypothetical protein